MPRVSYAGGVVRALLAAGPIFLGILMVGVLLFYPQHIPSGWEVLGLIPLLMMSAAVGFTLSLLPILIGSFVMATAGIHVRWTRLPALWASVGALLANIAIFPIGNNFSNFDPGSFTLFGLTGAICALIVRYGTRWSDDRV
ncbi:hypothetical protein ABS767_12590 [Sphingomonas sp. ST-64]|uniref:SPW repeat-containing protein n=1 Tax=Sphingomonas plantiphila TaxID=3163295 RepID=A0ABW8YNE9_9SPHN